MTSLLLDAKWIIGEVLNTYPKTNIIFQAPEKAVLFQNGVRQGLNEDIRNGGNLVELLKVFFGYREPHHEEWDEAVAAFKERIPAVGNLLDGKFLLGPLSITSPAPKLPY